MARRRVAESSTALCPHRYRLGVLEQNEERVPVPRAIIRPSIFRAIEPSGPSRGCRFKHLFFPDRVVDAKHHPDPVEGELRCPAHCEWPQAPPPKVNSFTNPAMGG